MSKKIDFTPRITHDLHATLNASQHIQEVYFTSDGHHHFQAYAHQGEMYTRLSETPEVKNGVYTNRVLISPVLGADGKPDPTFLVAARFTREQVLAMKPTSYIGQELLDKAQIVKPSQADILDVLGISAEDFERLKAKSKK
jgi:hypothetical protein